MAKASESLGAATTLVVSMGNDLYDGCEATLIAQGLKEALSVVPDAHVVYGGSASVWGYSKESYGRGVEEICLLLGCPNGAAELLSVRTCDAIGHLHVESVALLCKAVVQWCKTILSSRMTKARL